jgi:putative transposase
MGRPYIYNRIWMQYHRRSIRLRNYDYGQAGAYFVTICAYKRQYLFGDIQDGEMARNVLG